MQKWEYYRYDQSFHIKLIGKAEWDPSPDLADLGKKGWELINVVPCSFERAAGLTTTLTFFFKRPLIGQPFAGQSLPTGEAD